ncbi:MAG: hypothetical protein AB7L66_10420 [Gemmatimonadales bacterium]
MNSYLLLMAMALPGDTLRVPPGRVASLDGRIDPLEWAGATITSLSDGTEVLWMHDDRGVQLAVRGAPAIVSVCLARGDTVTVLHASAALGTARFVRADTGWRRVADFVWDRSAQDGDGREAAGEWRASPRGRPVELEIGMSRLGAPASVAVATMAPTIGRWPPELADDCGSLGLLMGTAPLLARFNPAAWSPVLVVQP